MIYYYATYGLIFAGASYFIIIFIFDLLLRGFVPFLPSRPWVVEEVLAELELPKGDGLMIAFSSGRSGFFHALEKRYPSARLIGVESSLFPFVVARAQTLIRKTKIRVVFEKVRHTDVSGADFIYCHLYPNDMGDLGAKLKFECKSGAVVVSTGFNIPGLNPAKIIDLPDRKGRLDFLSKNQKLFQRKSKKYKKEKKAYYYVI